MEDYIWRIALDINPGVFVVVQEFFPHVSGNRALGCDGLDQAWLFPGNDPVGDELRRQVVINARRSPRRPHEGEVPELIAGAGGDRAVIFVRGAGVDSRAPCM